MAPLTPKLQRKDLLDLEIQRLTSGIEDTHGPEKATKLKADIRKLCVVALKRGSETALTQLGEAAVNQASDNLNITGSALNDVRMLAKVILERVEIESRESNADSEAGLVEGNDGAVENASA